MKRSPEQPQDFGYEEFDKDIATLIFNLSVEREDLENHIKAIQRTEIDERIAPYARALQLIEEQLDLLDKASKSGPMKLREKQELVKKLYRIRQEELEILTTHNVDSFGRPGSNTIN